MTDTELYAALYDIVESRMQSEGRSLGIEKALCVDLAVCPPGHADVLALSYEPDGILFLKKAYQTMLQRPIDDGALETISKQANEPVQDFQSGVVCGLKGSDEFVMSRTILEHNLYTDNAPYAEAPVTGRFSSVPLPERLLRFYRKMPEPMKKAAKKILGAK